MTTTQKKSTAKGSIKIITTSPSFNDRASNYSKRATAKGNGWHHAAPKFDYITRKADPLNRKARKTINGEHRS
jgi:hypothetical protein